MARLILILSTVLFVFNLLGCATAPVPLSIEEQRWFDQAKHDPEKY
jgi:hypothetical protein